MPVTKSAAKALRTSRHKKKYNDQVRKKLGEAVKKTAKKPSAENLKKAYQAIDRAVGKKTIHSNRASRLKSRLTRLVSVKKVSSQKEKK